MQQTVAEIRAALAGASRQDFEALARTLQDDSRKGVQTALMAARKRLEAQEAEAARLEGLYAYEAEVAGGKLVVGLDEVGRGPLAGPLTVGAVVLNSNAPHIEGLNDSKQVSEAKRPALAEAVRQASLAFSLVHIEPAELDEQGMTACLRKAFRQAIARIEAQGIVPEVILLDGNPLHLDKREINVVRGDARCASIAAASLIAKVERDSVMMAYDAQYPGYDFASSKGYGSAKHCSAIEQQGLTPIHRVSFCRNFLQDSLF